VGHDGKLAVSRGAINASIHLLAPGRGTSRQLQAIEHALDNPRKHVAEDFNSAMRCNFQGNIARELAGGYWPELINGAGWNEHTEATATFLKGVIAEIADY